MRQSQGKLLEALSLGRKLWNSELRGIVSWKEFKSQIMQAECLQNALIDTLRPAKSKASRLTQLDLIRFILVLDNVHAKLLEVVPMKEVGAAQISRDVIESLEVDYGATIGKIIIKHIPSFVEDLIESDADLKDTLWRARPLLDVDYPRAVMELAISKRSKLKSVLGRRAYEDFTKLLQELTISTCQVNIVEFHSNNSIRLYGAFINLTWAIQPLLFKM